MFKDHSFIDLPKDMPKEVFESLKQVWVQGHQLNLSIDRGRPRPGGKGGKFSGKGGGGFRKEADSAKVEVNQKPGTAIVISARSLRESLENK